MNAADYQQLFSEILPALQSAQLYIGYSVKQMPPKDDPAWQAELSTHIALPVARHNLGECVTQANAFIADINAITTDAMRQWDFQFRSLFFYPCRDLMYKYIGNEADGYLLGEIGSHGDGAAALAVFNSGQTIISRTIEANTAQWAISE